MASKEDPAVQFWEFVEENLLQFHCENVSWEQASDKIPIKVVVELLGDLITHVNTCLLLRDNRLLFTLNWEIIENGQVVWEHLYSFHLNQKRRLETLQYQCDYMLTSVSSYTDLVDTYNADVTNLEIDNKKASTCTTQASILVIYIYADRNVRPGTIQGYTLATFPKVAQYIYAQPEKK